MSASNLTSKLNALFTECEQKGIHDATDLAAHLRDATQLPPCPACDKMRVLLTEAELERLRLQRDLAFALTELSALRSRQPVALPTGEYENQYGV